MRTLFQIFLTAALAYFLRLYMPWWSIAVASCIVSMMFGKTVISSFLGGFLGISILWMVYSSVIDFYSNAILSRKIVELLGVNNIALLIIITGIVGGLVGGMAAIFGLTLKKNISN